MGNRVEANASLRKVGGLGTHQRNDYLGEFTNTNTKRIQNEQTDSVINMSKLIHCKSKESGHLPPEIKEASDMNRHFKNVDLSTHMEYAALFTHCNQ